MKDTVVLDLETLGSLNNSVILSVGMVAVDSAEDYEFADLIKHGFYAKLDVASQVKDGRKIYKDTLDWWEKQGPDAQRILKPLKTDMHWSKLMPAMFNWFKKEGIDFDKAKFYSRGSHFDFALLHDLFRITGDAGAMEIPWRYWNIHDSKTVVETLLGHDVDVNPKGFIHHDCLHDAAREYLKMELAIYQFQQTLEDKND